MLPPHVPLAVLPLTVPLHVMPPSSVIVSELPDTLTLPLEPSSQLKVPVQDGFDSVRVHPEGVQLPLTDHVPDTSLQLPAAGDEAPPDPHPTSRNAQDTKKRSEPDHLDAVTVPEVVPSAGGVSINDVFVAQRLLYAGRWRALETR